MDWRIVILDDFTVEVVPKQFITKERTCWLPYEKNGKIFETAIKYLEVMESDEGNTEMMKNGKYRAVKCVIEEPTVFTDYDSVITRLKQISKGMMELVEGTTDREEKKIDLGVDDSLAKEFAQIDLAKKAEPKTPTDIVELYQTSMQFQNGFDHFVSEFFKSCKNSRAGATFWIIKLTRIYDDERESTFAAGKNDWGRHVEKVFTDWWKLCRGQPQNGQYKYEFEVYTNYTPCIDCAGLLSGWLKKLPDVELSIYYAFVFVDYRCGTRDEVKKLIELRNLKNFAKIQKMGNALLKKLAEDVGYVQDNCPPCIAVDNYNNSKYESKINYQRPIEAKTKNENKTLEKLQETTEEKKKIDG